MVSTAEDSANSIAIERMRMRRNFIVGRWWCGLEGGVGLIDRCADDGLEL